MINEKVKEVVITIRSRSCDICNKEIHKDMQCSLAICDICKKDLCEDHVFHEEYSSGDYRTVFCEKCWNKGESYREKIKKLEDEIERLNDEWIKSCTNNGDDKKYLGY